MTYTAEEIKSANPKRCWVDNNKSPDKHHIFPVEYGGPENGLTVPLCTNCHRNVHREAESLYKTQVRGSNVNRETYPDIDEYNKALFLSDYIVKSKTQFELSGEEKALGARNMLQVSFERDELAMAHDLKLMLGMRSLPSMVKLLIIEEWKRQKQKGK